MAFGIRAVQNGITLATGASVHPAPITVEPGILLTLSFTGPAIVNRWALPVKPLGSSTVLSSTSSPIPTILTDVVGGVYQVTFTDDVGVVYALDIGAVTPISPSSNGFFYPENYGAVGDGIVNDSVAMNAMFAAMTSGAVVWLRAGANYKITSEIAVTNKTRFKIVGNGATISPTTNIQCISFSTCSGFEVEGVRVVGTLQTDGGDNPAIIGTTILNISQGVFRLHSCTDVDIHNCRWEDIGGYMVFIGDLNTNVRVHHCDGIRTQAGIQTGGGVGVNNVNLEIDHNYLLGNVWASPSVNKTTGSDDQIAAFDGLSGKLLIHHNIIDKQGLIDRNGVVNSGATNQARGIDITMNPGTSMLDLIVSDNIVVNCISTNVTYARPAIEVIGDAAATIKNMVIARNVVRNCNQGIALIGPGMSNLSVDDNVISDVVFLAGHAESATGGHGILMDGLTGTMTEFSCSGNKIARTGNNSLCYGINVNQMVKGIFSNNVVTECPSRCLQVLVGTDVIISGNVLNTTAGDYPLVLSGYTDFVVSGNHCKGGSVAQLSLQSNANAAIFFGNKFSGATKVADSSTASTNRFIANDDYLVASKTFDWPNIASGATSTTTVTVTDAAVGDGVEVSHSISLAGMSLTGYVSAANTVTCVMTNNTGGAVDLASGTLKAWVTKR